MSSSLELPAFKNRFVTELPGEADASRHSRAVHGACYSLVRPVPVSAPSLVAYSRDLAERLRLDGGTLESSLWLGILSGNTVSADMQPYACCYGGHQFGTWAGQLGDGRAITLGELVDREGCHQELQLKGSGRTPYSRTGDGRAVMRSSIREFLASEAMFGLGVPTTRALSLVATGDRVLRDMFYDGNAREEPGAIVCRVAPSFVRFGNFEIFSSRGDLALLRRLVDYTIDALFPEIARTTPGLEKYAMWFAEVCERTALLVAHWQRVGFVHGVMNTDNMSILGLTLDYGPFGFLDHFQADFTPNTSDPGRYRFMKQPMVAKWNLLKLAEALFPLIESARPLEAGLTRFSEAFEAHQRRMQAEKLGLPDADLFDDLLEVLGAVETDFTLFFRGLARVSTRSLQEDEELLAPLQNAFYDFPEMQGNDRQRVLAWLRRYVAAAQLQGLPDPERRERMDRVNPKYILRNYQAQLASDAAEQGDFQPTRELLEVLSAPYDEQPEHESYAARRPAWAKDRAGCSRLSCSS
ncbi:MAG TPA: YdiU family protein [Polyangiaceae bacterium]|nr:YdiU family protein [Polyangiaceae bacterium]